jgi:hypothetical protein
MYDGLLLFIQEIKDIILNFMESPRLRVRDPPNQNTYKINGKKTRTDPPPLNC